MGENVRIVRLGALDGGKVTSANAAEEKLIGTKRGRLGDIK